MTKPNYLSILKTLLTQIEHRYFSNFSNEVGTTTTHFNPMLTKHNVHTIMKITTIFRLQ